MGTWRIGREYMEKERLNKYLAACGLCSRREADRLIEEGAVSVNGGRAVPGMQVSAGDQIMVNGKSIHGKDEKVVLAYYKPVGVTCTEKDKFADKKITDMVKFPVRVTYAGRLDKDSEGLMILTNDGGLINAMMRGSGGHEKEYVVRAAVSGGEDGSGKTVSFPSVILPVWCWGRGMAVMYSMAETIRYWLNLRGAWNMQT